MNHKLHYNTESVYCYGIIHNFFDYYGFRPAVKIAEQIIAFATDNRFWNKEAPYHVVFFLEHLERLITTVFIIEKKRYHLKKAKLLISGDSKPDIHLKKNFVHPYQKGSAWEYFPRHLSAKQYADPYLSLEKFTAVYTKAEWEEILVDLREYALSKSSISGSYDACEILFIRKRILQLIEVCHLLEVRTYKKQKP